MHIWDGLNWGCRSLAIQLAIPEPNDAPPGLITNKDPLFTERELAKLTKKYWVAVSHAEP